MKAGMLVDKIELQKHQQSTVTAPRSRPELTQWSSLRIAGIASCVLAARFPTSPPRMQLPVLEKDLVGSYT
jgi:hypothetical protein